MYPQIVNAVLDALKLGFEAVMEIGGNLVIGLWNGINDKVGWIVDKVKGFGGDVAWCNKKAFDINSPSESSGGLDRCVSKDLNSH